MKKQVVSVIVGAAMTAGMLAGCGSSTASTSSASSAASSSSAAAESTSSSATSEAVSSNSVASTSTAASGDGEVYLLNFKPETDDAWQQLASDYTNETGVPVTVVTAADGQYNTTLQSEMAKTEAPTIFNIGSSKIGRAHV